MLMMALDCTLQLAMHATSRLGNNKIYSEPTNLKGEKELAK